MYIRGCVGVVCMENSAQRAPGDTNQRLIDSLTQ